jgi:hypothetical protein
MRRVQRVCPGHTIVLSGVVHRFYSTNGVSARTSASLRTDTQDDDKQSGTKHRRSNGDKESKLVWHFILYGTFGCLGEIYSCKNEDFKIAMHQYLHCIMWIKSAHKNSRRTWKLRKAYQFDEGGFFSYSDVKSFT